jgi:hypothetical protein
MTIALVRGQVSKRYWIRSRKKILTGPANAPVVEIEVEDVLRLR